MKSYRPPACYNNRYTPKRVLGTGTYGQVILCHDRKKDCDVAVKVSQSDPAYSRSALNEIDVFRLFRQLSERDEKELESLVLNAQCQGTQNLTEEEATFILNHRKHACYHNYYTGRIIGSFNDNGHVCFATELLEKNLLEVLKERGYGPLSRLSDIRKVAYNVLVSLQTLHRAGYIHCDIKPENVMIRKATSVPEKKLSNTDASIRVNSPSDPNIRAKSGTSPFNGSGSDTNSSTNTNNNNTVTVTVHEKGMKPRRYVTCALGPSSSDEEDTTDFSSSENDSEVGDNNVLHDARSIDFGNTCLIDFGAVRQYHENNYYDIQSLWYRAPEVVCGVPYTNKIDSFSVGCVLFELYTGKPLFSGDSGLLQLTYVTQLLGLPSPASLSSGKYSSTMQPVFQQYMHSNQMQQQLNGNGGADHLQIFADWTRECRKIGEARYEKFCARQGKVVDEDFAVDAQEEQLFIQLLFQLLFPDEMGRIDCEKALQHHFFLYAGETEERHLFTSALYRSSPEATLGKKTEYTSNNGNHQRRATKPAHHTIHVKVPVQEVLHGMTPNQHSSTVEPVGNNCFVPIRVLQQPVNGGGTDRPEGSPVFFNQVPPLLHLPAVPFSPSSSPVNNHPYLPASPQQHSPSMEMYYLSGSNNNNNNNNMNNNHNHNHNHHFNGSSYVGSPHSCRTPQFLPLTTISSLRDSPEMVALNNDNRNTNNNNNNNSNSNKMQFHLYNENQPHPQNGSILSYQQQNNNTLAEPHPLLAEQNKVLLQLMTPTNLILTTGNNNYNHNNNNNNNNQNFIVSPNHYYNTTNYGIGEANYHAGAPPFFGGMKESNNNNNNNNSQFHYNPQQNNNNNNNNMNMQNFTVLPECY